MTEDELEQKAKKWVKEHTEIEYKASYGEFPKEPSAMKSFKAGAEFGYNKAKVEVEESYRESLCNSELNLASVTEQLEELEKANEWHYVKDGDLPKDDENFICMLENGYKLECFYDPASKRWYDNFFHHDIEYGYYQSNVIAWKEIVLPKELKND